MRPRYVRSENIKSENKKCLVYLPWCLIASWALWSVHGADKRAALLTRAGVAGNSAGGASGGATTAVRSDELTTLAATVAELQTKVASQVKSIKIANKHLKKGNLTTAALPSIPQVLPLQERNFELAVEESDGFFDDIPERDWKRMTTRHSSFPNCQFDCQENRPQMYWQMNFEPTWSCTHEARVGGLGDGGKWVCDPHRIKPKDCLVYSVGSENDFTFEETILRDISADCEIHTFDPTVGNSPSNKPPSVHFHPWGIGDPSETSVVGSNLGNIGGLQLRSMEQIVTELGHRGRQIDIFKIDCEGCEWTTFKGWFGEHVNMRQILVELHGGSMWPKWQAAKQFMLLVQEQGFVAFHKEPNIQHPVGGNVCCVEYGFVRLNLDKDKRISSATERARKDQGILQG